jgi:4-amino-4-deoxy-L-arabinose transferase-like glycosyltransferase
VLQWSGLALFTALALPWYVAVTRGNPGLFRYFVGDEVIGRITTNEFGRHGEWYGWLEIYVPTLLIGTLPWTPTLWRWARAAAGDGEAMVGQSAAPRTGRRLASAGFVAGVAAAAVLPGALAHAAVPAAAVRGHRRDRGAAAPARRPWIARLAHVCWPGSCCCWR